MRKNLLLVGAGLAIGLVLFAFFRFIIYRSQDVHYHANMAVYINGQREAFSDPSYYQEVVSCSADESNDPLHRVHMHNRVNDVVHVHAKAVTWGQFFNNIGWSAGKDHLSTLTQTLVNNGNSKVSYLLNGQPVSDVAGLTIKSEDKLLVSYGDQTPPQLQQAYAAIAGNAQQYNQAADPASCGGAHTSGWKARLENIWQ